MLRSGVGVAVVAVVHTLSTGARAQQGNPFFAKAGVGAGWSSMSWSQSSEDGEVASLGLSGRAVAFEATLGIGVLPRTVFGAGYFGVIAPDTSGTYEPHQFDDAVEQETTGQFGLGLFGPTLIFYFDSQKQASVSLCVGISYVDPPARHPVVGPGIAVGVSYDFWVAKRFALGPHLRFIHAEGVAGDFEPEGSGDAVALGVSATTF